MTNYPPGQFPTTDQPVQADEPVSGGVNYTNNIAQWAQFDPCNRVLSKIHGFFSIPAFNVAVNPQLAGPYAVLQFNYSATGNLTITGFPTIPDSPNYIPVIRFTDPDTGDIVRYKIWGITGDTIYWPLYTGQWIEQEFCIEIWSFIGQATAVQTTALQFQSSRTQIRTNPSGAGSYTEASPAQVVTLFNTNVGLTLPLTFDLDAVMEPPIYVGPPAPTPPAPVPALNWRINSATGNMELYNITTGEWNPIVAAGPPGQETIVIEPQH